MTRASPHQRLEPSLFDRLIDEDEIPRVYQLKQLREHVRRDLQDLLNTRVRALAWPAECTELSRSLLNYGIPDFSRARLGTVEDRQAFLDQIKEAIRLFEPRLDEVQVELLQTSDAINRQLQFRIKATLLCQPAPQPVAFDSSLQAATGAFQVEESAMIDDSDYYKLYDDELSFVRKLGAAFAGRYPRIAGRLRLGDAVSEDPHVERLIQAFAYLNARTRHKLDDDFPEISDALLNVLYPHYLRPVPSMSIVEFALDRGQGQLTTRYTIPAEKTTLETGTPQGQECRFRTCYPVHLWPIKIESARLSPLPFSAPGTQFPDKVKSILKLELKTFDADITFAKLDLGALRFYLKGQPSLVYPLYEMLLNNTLEVVLANRHDDPHATRLSQHELKAVGFERDEGLLPMTPQSHPAYRLFTEFFALPEKFLFFDLGGLDARALRNLGRTMEVYFYFNSPPGGLQQHISSDTFRMGCTPIVNLFERSAEPIQLSRTTTEHRVAPSASNALAFEVFSIERVSSISPREEAVYQPFYSTKHFADSARPAAFWHAIRRTADEGGTEVYLQLVDLDFRRATAADADLHIELLCTNRDLPRNLPFGGGEPHLHITAGGPLTATCLKQFTPTLRPVLGRGAQWRLLSHLSLNHLSLVDNQQGAEALREMLALYDVRDSAETQAIVEGLLSVQNQAAVARVAKGPAAVGICRGLDITVNFDEAKFAGSGVFLFASVLERFLGLWCSINSFSRLIAKTKQRGELRKWSPRAGERILC